MSPPKTKIDKRIGIGKHSEGGNMLVIGFRAKDKSHYSVVMDIDLDIDSPRRIHDLLKKEANGLDFDHIVCVEDDAVVAEFTDEEDYDLTEPPEDDDEEDVDEEHLDEDDLESDEDEDD
jgi:hypothetical protein